MREIKFRAWDKPINRWYSPVYEAYKGQLEELNISMNGRLSLRTMSGTADESTFKDRFILMQFTGLKDKNGVEIYDGDILEYQPDDYEPGESSDKYVVEWRVKEFVGVWENDKGFKNRDNDGLKDSHIDIAVIGNVHENPELLKAKE